MKDKFTIKDLNFWYGEKQALKNISLVAKDRKVTALIGPSGCGKTTFLRCLNRMHDLYPGNRYKGEILLDGRNILDKGLDLIKLRSKVGMVFQKPTPFPMSIYENIAFGLKLMGVKSKSEISGRVEKALKDSALKLMGVKSKSEISGRVEKALKDSALWEEIKNRLNEPALSLSGGQQQRLCIARAVAVEPEVILMDEPCSALDPVATAKIEDLMTVLKQSYTVIIVTHNMQQAARVSEFTGFFMLGEVVEFDTTERIFTAPSNKLTEDYITGRFG